MGTTDRPADRGRRLGTRLSRELGEQARLGRIAAGLSQETVARTAGLSRSALGRIERGQRASVGLVELSTVLAVVGLRLSARAFPDGTPYRDDGHRRLGEGTRDLLPGRAPWRTEVAFPNPGDLRSWDAMSVLEDLRVGFEFETHPRDGQDLLRRMNQKRRDGHVDRMVLVLADTAANRLFLVDHGAALREAFPTPAADVIRALRGGRAPGDGVIVVRPRPRARSPAEEDAGRRQPAGRRSRRTGVGSG